MIVLFCLTCHGSMLRRPCLIDRAKYCSRNCQTKAQRGSKRSPHSKETKLKMSLSAMGENNSQWKGDRVGYTGLHYWAKSRLLKPHNCPRCGLDKRLDLANISGKYLRDLSDWEYLCRKCHMTVDGRWRNLKNQLWI